MGFLKYIAEHGWSLFEHSIVGAGLFFHALFYWQDIKARRIENLVRFTEQHHKIMSDLLSNPNTERIFDERADASLISSHELHGVNSILMHLRSGVEAAKAGLYKLPEKLDADVREFLSLPIPHAAWKQLSPRYNQDFVTYIAEDAR